MKKLSIIWILVVYLIIFIQLLNDFIQITFQDQFYEGYGYAVYLLLFDLALIVPIIITLFFKDSFLISWVLITSVIVNLTIGFGWQWGSLIGLLTILISIIVFIKNKRLAIKSVLSK